MIAAAKNRFSLFLCFVLGLAFLGGSPALAQSSANYRIWTSVIGGGGGIGSSSGYSLLSTLGQPSPIGPGNSAGYRIYGGFIYTLPFEALPFSSLADYDGDGLTDVAAFHLLSDQFFTNLLGNMGQYGWGGADCYPIIWDYDGDGRTDVSIYHIPTNQWFVKGVLGDNLGQFGWGGDESIPVPGDYNGDGIPERAFYHWPTNRWFVEGQEPVQFGYGGAESIPFAVDHNGDGRTDMVIYHVASNQWFVHGIGELGQFGWGGSNCLPVPGDWNGDGNTEIGIVYIPDNEWIWRDGRGSAHFMGQYGWGGMESFPVPGDYNGDGVMERGFYRSAQNWWFLEGQGDFVWGYDGEVFMPITSQVNVFNWFREVLGRFQ